MARPKRIFCLGRQTHASITREQALLVQHGAQSALQYTKVEDEVPRPACMSMCAGRVLQIIRQQAC